MMMVLLVMLMAIKNNLNKYIIMKVIINRLEDLYYNFFHEILEKYDFSEKDEKLFSQYQELIYNTIEQMKKAVVTLDKVFPNDTSMDNVIFEDW